MNIKIQIFIPIIAIFLINTTLSNDCLELNKRNQRELYANTIELLNEAKQQNDKDLEASLLDEIRTYQDNSPSDAPPTSVTVINIGSIEEFDSLEKRVVEWADSLEKYLKILQGNYHCFYSYSKQQKSFSVFFILEYPTPKEDKKESNFNTNSLSYVSSSLNQDQRLRVYERALVMSQSLVPTTFPIELLSDNDLIFFNFLNKIEKDILLKPYQRKADLMKLEEEIEEVEYDEDIPILLPTLKSTKLPYARQERFDKYVENVKHAPTPLIPFFNFLDAKFIKSVLEKSSTVNDEKEKLYLTYVLYGNFIAKVECNLLASSKKLSLGLSTQKQSIEEQDLTEELDPAFSLLFRETINDALNGDFLDIHKAFWRIKEEMPQYEPAESQPLITCAKYGDQIKEFFSVLLKPTLPDEEEETIIDEPSKEITEQKILL